MYSTLGLPSDIVSLRDTDSGEQLGEVAGEWKSTCVVLGEGKYEAMDE